MTFLDTEMKELLEVKYDIFSYGDEGTLQKHTA